MTALEVLAIVVVWSVAAFILGVLIGLGIRGRDRQAPYEPCDCDDCEALRQRTISPTPPPTWMGGFRLATGPGALDLVCEACAYDLCMVGEGDTLHELATIADEHECLPSDDPDDYYDPDEPGSQRPRRWGR